MPSIAAALASVRQRIATAEQRFGRTPGSVDLLAVSKTRTADEIREAAAAGQRCFGESYPQEASAKRDLLAELGLEWHFIGPIQSNKTKVLAQDFDWVHSVDRLKVAHRLNDQRPDEAPALNVCLQVNTSGEESKAGVAPAEVFQLAEQVAQLPRLRLRGLMTIPAPEPDFGRQRRPFRQLYELWAQLQQGGLAVDTLSMGMTDDLEAAVAEGSTLVRIGTGIFGPRRPAGE